ncbi:MULTISPECIES: signal peptide peptidase SppA [Gordonibacter]|uniref:Signal peptide peptidase SppA n=1 Tax=Gordonibacter faecis TaxID=3047475 RepID=A0ABT7DQB7_9ACTN|nr:MULTISPECIES: signal peptide peptidase SppA [unclassified Gordonibacter]MDJ1651750.1 signal peptide peptidase SppA [Gordonibacter sp. KGMB12511]HIW75714.1 signal peptide peptidase SppA [Candidatus Gordonibacter avicola]
MSQDTNWQQQAWQQPATPPSQPPVYYYGAPQPQPPKKSRGWIVGLAVVLCLFGLIALSMWSCTSVVSSSFDSITPGSTSVDLGSLSSDAIAVIDIDGTIQYDGTTASPEGLKAQLDRAEKSFYVKAVVLRINSGGGTATAGEEMAAYVREFSENSGKPVVVSSASINASAAYEISSQADYIFTAKTTAIGSIGTAMQVTDLSGLMEKLGISVENITSSDSKDSSYGTRALTEEERAYYQKMVDQINETFIQTVAEGRDMSVEDVRKLATGLTFTGMEAVENGLADEIGTKEDAVAKAAELAGTSTTKTVDLRPSTSNLSELLNLMSSSRVSVDDVTKALKELDNDGSLAR